MTTLRRARTIPLIVFVMLGASVVACATAAPAPAALIRHGHFVFKGYTKNHDPINLLLRGGSNLPDQCINLNLSGQRNYSPSCWEYLHARDRKKDDPRGPIGGGRMIRRAYCNGRDTAYFYRPNGGLLGEVNPLSDSTSDICKNQFHVRMWDDHVVNEDAHEQGQWSIGVIYWEKRCLSCVGTGSHKASRWETAEDTERYQMGRSTDGEPAQCTYPDYRVVTDQKPGKYRGWYNSGKISRVSAQAINSSAPAGHKCDGG
jgi:hypothetical protein